MTKAHTQRLEPEVALAARKVAKESPWARILLAAHEGRGCRLTADEVWTLSMDSAIEAKAYNDITGLGENHDWRR